MPTPRLPSVGSDANNWGTLLNDYLQQALGSDGTLVTTSTNSYTGLANTNLASGSRPGLVQLAGDLGNTAVSPTVTGLQGNPVAATGPTDGYVLTWSVGNGQWQPAAPTGAGGFLADLDGGNASSVYGGVASIDGGLS